MSKDQLKGLEPKGSEVVVKKYVNLTFSYNTIEELEEKLSKIKLLESTQFPNLGNLGSSTLIINF